MSGPKSGDGRCLYCGFVLERIDIWQTFESEWGEVCKFCGWSWREQRIDDDGETYYGDCFYRILRQFSPVVGGGVALSELRDHLAKKEISTFLSPRQFEEVVESVFKNFGFRTSLTSYSRDGGYDILLLQNTGGAAAIVEVKRYKQKVGVELVRQLRGVQLREGSKRAILVTSSSFTQGASLEAGSACSYGFEMGLIDAERLLRVLDLYNEEAESLGEALNGRKARYGGST